MWLWTAVANSHPFFGLDTGKLLSVVWFVLYGDPAKNRLRGTTDYVQDRNRSLASMKIM